ncbi:MAG TPA: GntR family transcriptional regulator [Dongiaceae bacterium]|jgi:DNA-binding GntR family transcriptional regulator|nr:GntR family transcriptional regulator [Dongiaceae bacterium]
MARTGVTLQAARSAKRNDFRVDRRLPAAEQVYRGLREAIITCRLEPNEAISESRLCGMFHVSRSPVRTAITRLAEDGLIDIFPQRGTFVAPIKLKQVREAQFARQALEVALIAEAARRWTDADSRAIKANLALQVQHAKAGEGWAFYLDNEGFHQIVARAAQLEGVWATVQSVKMLWDRIGHIANRVPAHRTTIIEEHRRIVRALEKRDPEAAAAAMQLHMGSVDHAIARLRPLHADYFVDE